MEKITMLEICVNGNGCCFKMALDFISYTCLLTGHEAHTDLTQIIFLWETCQMHYHIPEGIIPELSFSCSHSSVEFVLVCMQSAVQLHRDLVNTQQ